MKSKIALFVSLALVAGSVVAADSGFYVGAGLGYSNVSLDKGKITKSLNNELPGAFAVTSSNLDNAATPYQFFVGYKFMPYLAAEVGWLDMGSVQYKAAVSDGELTGQVKGTFSASGWPVSALGIYPIDDTWSVFGRVGMFFNSVTATAHAYDELGDPLLRAHETNNTSNFFGGLGVDAGFMDNWAARLEWQAIPGVGNNKTGNATFNNLNLSIMYKF